MEKEFKEIKKVALNHAKRVDEEVYKRLTEMEEEKTSLSSKRNTIDDNFNVTYNEKDVKEAIKRLKDGSIWSLDGGWLCISVSKFDKIIGDKLVK